MPAADRARLKMEAGQNFVAMDELSNSGDNTRFNGSGADWSNAAGRGPTVLPNGLRTGVAISATGVNDEVEVSGGEANLNGVIATVVADTSVTVGRPASNKVRKVSIVLDDDGTIDAVSGADGDSFSDTRAANGGPPLIPADNIEIGQVWLTDDTAAPIDDSEIKQIIGYTREMFNFPLFNTSYDGGYITFIQELDEIHTGPVTKKVFAEYYTPIMMNLQRASNFKFPEETFSQSSEQTYDGPVASSSRALGQGGFDIKTENGITDPVVAAKNDFLWFHFFPDRNKSAYGKCQGFLGINRAFPADANMSSTCTISAEQPAVEKAA